MTQAEDGKIDPPQLVAVTMTTPDCDCRQPGSLCLQRYEIANACLIQSSSIVDNQDVALPRIVDDLEEDIYAPIMARRHCLARDEAGTCDHVDSRGGNACMNSEPN